MFSMSRELFESWVCPCKSVDKGVIGGGQTRDQIDGLCGQLYKCYKCLNIDYGNQETLFNYDVSLIAHDDGSRELKCLGMCFSDFKLEKREKEFKLKVDTNSPHNLLTFCLLTRRRATSD